MFSWDAIAIPFVASWRPNWCPQIQLVQRGLLYLLSMERAKQPIIKLGLLEAEVFWHGYFGHKVCVLLMVLHNAWSCYCRRGFFSFFCAASQQAN
jgi:hypothetical protein